MINDRNKISKIYNVITHPCLIIGVCKMVVVVVVMIMFCLLMAIIGEWTWV